MAETVIKNLLPIKFGTMSSTDQVDANQTAGLYKISIGLIQSVSYIRFDISWVVFEIKTIGTASTSTQWRVKYGDSTWTSWTAI